MLSSTGERIGKALGVIVRTPPGKKSMSARFGDMPIGTSEGSRSVIQVPKTFNGRGENDSMLIDLSQWERSRCQLRGAQLGTYRSFLKIP
jgi:hypothetical protein